MSRHDVTPLPGQEPGLEIAIGWDPPLQSYYVQVMCETEDGEMDILLWEGCAIGEITNVDAAIALLEPWAAISAELRYQLILDQLGRLHAPHPAAR